MNIKRPLLAALLATALTTSVALATGWTFRMGTDSPTVETTLSTLIQNEHLRVCGTTIAYDSQLIWAARYKAMDMGYRNTMTHTLVDGKRMWDFYAQAGIPRTYGSGEIIAWNNYPDDQTAQVTWSSWMNSSTHRAIIQNCAYDRFGLGAFQTTGAPEGKKWFAGEFTNTAQ